MSDSVDKLFIDDGAAFLDEPGEDIRPAYQLDGKDCTREAFYAVACDPTRHVVVQACAGAGKTWMLVSRIVRALLLGTPAHEILAITFTKKAAGEMRARLQEWLAEFSKADDTQLAQALITRGIPSEIALQANGDERKQLSNLYQTVLASGRGVQIRTFHSWFAALLRNAPLRTLEELQLPAQYKLIEDDSQAIALVWRRFYMVLGGDDALHAVYRETVAKAGRANTEKALTAALGKRVEFELADVALAAGAADSASSVVARSVPGFAQEFPDFSGLEHPEDMLATAAIRHMLTEAAAHLSRAPQTSYAAKGVELAVALGDTALRDTTLRDTAIGNSAIGDAAIRANSSAVFGALLTLKNEPRKFSDKIVGIKTVRMAQELCMRVQLAVEQHEAWQHQQRMAQLLRALIQCLGDVKREHAWVDMGDIERAATHLLSDPVLSGWVQQRLDATISQVLIDEFQDTNPLQWQALQAWLSGYVGSGAGQVPGVFIVGDPKQSIYRFRRAEPQVFLAATEFVRHGLGGTVLSCDHTRRNARAVLAATNGVMLHAAQLGYEGFRTHTTESSEPGAVLRLPQVGRPEKQVVAPRAAWRDTLNEPRVETEDALRTLECRQAAQWVAQHLASGITIQSGATRRPLEPGDIMVLSRKRDRLQRMRAELQSLGISYALSEKTKLMDHAEVQDVVALVDALVSPTNNLALARALKSPLFGLLDEDLMAIAQIAQQHQCSWWTSLSKTELLAQHLRALQADLTKYQAWFEQLPPHDALAAVYHHGKVLQRFMAAAPFDVRQRVAANLQALLAAALDIDGGRFVTPYAWVRALKANTVPAPGNAMAQGHAVSLLTVHGAKGLEAHTVLLLDTDAPPEKTRTMDVLIDWPAAQQAPTLFAFIASESRAPRSVQAALQAEQEARNREETNALYVAMTRAQNTLVISSCEPHNADPLSPWQRFAQVEAALVHDLEHDQVQRLALPNTVDGAKNQAQPLQTEKTVMNQSFYLPIIPEVPVEYAQAAIKSIVKKERNEPDNTASRIGQAMHRLLELYAPGIDLQKISSAVGAQFQLNPARSQQACEAAQRITQGEAAWVWDSAQVDWQANEVEMRANGSVLRIDRLVKHRASQTWWVLDFKSSAAPQHYASLRDQLAAYTAAVQTANPGVAVKSAFITAQGRLLEPDAI